MDGESLSLLNTKLWSSKFIELDVCGRPLFANLVTYAVIRMLVLNIVVHVLVHVYIIHRKVKLSLHANNHGHLKLNT